jgi:hypothetical protein
MRCYIRFWALTVPAILLTIPALTTRQVEAGYNLGAAADYAVLIEAGVSNFQLNNARINGNVGIGTGVDPIQIASNGFVNAVPGLPGSGRMDFASNSVPSISNPANVAGGLFFNQPQVTTALNTVNSLNSTLGAEAGTALTISGGGQLVNVSAGMLDAGGNRVFSLTAGSYNNNNGGFTVVGGLSDFVVFNINNGTSNEAIGGPISLSGGIISDHVLFNFVGTSGNLGGSAGGATVNGIFLAPNMLINIDNIDINGRLFGGRPGTGFSTVSGFDLFQPLPAPVPAPTSLVLLAIGGLGALGFHRLRGRKLSRLKRA